MKRIIKKIGKTIIKLISSIFQINLLQMAHNEMGISNHKNPKMFGEDFFIKKTLPLLLSKVEKPILFDIGANIGKYSTNLKSTFPTSRILAFEPNNSAFKELNQISKELGIEVFNTALSANSGETTIFLREGVGSSEHSSLYEESLKNIDVHKKILSQKIVLTTLDKFCQDNNIKQIDFIKIDTEGNERNILLGAKNLLIEDRIGVIQFEFNEKNVFSRVFLKDFYDLLPNFDLFRIKKEKLIHLGEYNSINEIFKIQNIVAIHK